MFQTNRFRRAAALALTLVLALQSLALQGLAVEAMPIQTAKETESVYLFNADTGEAILDQNAGQQRGIASLTKMMTALLLLESGKDLNGAVTVPDSLTSEFANIRSQGGTGIYLQPGEVVRRIDLLYALLVCSANDAASVIAWDVTGSQQSFVALMNARATQLGCTGTTFSCPHGLYDAGNASTAYDLARIALACAADPIYMQVADTLQYQMPATNLHAARTLQATNRLLDPEYQYYRADVHGMKTGFTSKAGRCYVGFATEEGRTYGVVILGSNLENVYKEAAQLLDWAFTEYQPAQAAA